MIVSSGSTTKEGIMITATGYNSGEKTATQETWKKLRIEYCVACDRNRKECNGCVHYKEAFEKKGEN